MTLSPTVVANEHANFPGPRDHPHPGVAVDALHWRVATA